MTTPPAGPGTVPAHSHLTHLQLTLSLEHPGNSERSRSEVQPLRDTFRARPLTIQPLILTSPWGTCPANCLLGDRVSQDGAPLFPSPGGDPHRRITGRGSQVRQKSAAIGSEGDRSASVVPGMRIIPPWQHGCGGSRGCIWSEGMVKSHLDLGRQGLILRGVILSSADIAPACGTRVSGIHRRLVDHAALSAERSRFDEVGKTARRRHSQTLRPARAVQRVQFPSRTETDCRSAVCCMRGSPKQVPPPSRNHFTSD